MKPIEQPTNESTGLPPAKTASLNEAGLISGQPQPENSSAFGVLELTAEVIHLANVAAKAFYAHPEMKGLFYGIKHSLLSTLLQAAVPGVEPSWERESSRDRMLRVSIANRRSLHCPITRLSWLAQCKVIERIGVSPR